MHAPRAIRQVSTFRISAALLALLLVLSCSLRVLAWGEMHSMITRGALNVLPQWQQDLFKDQRDTLIKLYCMIPDLAQAQPYQKEYGRYVILPNGDKFSHLPHKTRVLNHYQLKYYIDATLEKIKANEMEEAARYAGCLLHFLEDCGSPAHTIPGDNQLGLLKDLIGVPEAYKDRGLHGVVEEGKLDIDISGYKPQLLGVTADEAAFNLIERFNAMVRNARAQVIPILQGTYRDAQADIDTARRAAAKMDAEVVADALYTIISIARNRFDDGEKKLLETRDVASLTPTEVVHQSYFPQHAFFSRPFFGYPTPNGILEEGKKKHPLALNIMTDGKTETLAVERGFGTGTTTRLSFALPDRTYDKFECLVGLHAPLGKAGSAGFKIFADGAAVFDSGPISGDEPAQRVSLDVWKVKEISFLIEDRSADRAGKVYAVIGNPLLTKPKTPPVDKTQ